MRNIISHTRTSCNYKPEKQKQICDEFDVNSEEFIVVSHKTGCYKGLLSGKASFVSKKLDI